MIRKGKRHLLDDTDASRLLARLRNEAGMLHPNYIGMDGAINRFLKFFPGGFEDPLFAAEELAFKQASRDRLNAVLSLEDALEVEPNRAAQVRNAYVTNMLSPFELARSSAVLRGPTGAAFVRGAAQFAMGDYGAGLAAMSKAVEPQGRVSWPIVTYLPNLWLPKKHMFLKPVATLDFAQRTGHPFQYAYDPALTAGVYEALLEMVADTERGLSALAPRDRVDVQSFIWVVGDYGDAESAKLATLRNGKN